MMTPQRMVTELNLLYQWFKKLENFKLLNATTEHPVLWTPVVTSTDREFGLGMDLTGYPERIPMLFVPEELKKKDGSPMELSAEMHCLGIRDGKTFICHTNNWRPDTHLTKLYAKGKLWLECYVRHLQTGESIDYFLKHQK